MIWINRYKIFKNKYEKNFFLIIDYSALSFILQLGCIILSTQQEEGIKDGINTYNIMKSRMIQQVNDLKRLRKEGKKKRWSL